MTPELIVFNKIWSFPRPKKSYINETFNSQYDDEKVSQQRFYDEYHVSGHKIFDRYYYKDIELVDKDDKLIGYQEVDRLAFPIQFECIDIILAHVLGNHTQFKDSTVGENKYDLIAKYKEYWDTKNMETFRNDFIKAALSVGDVAGLFYFDEGVLCTKIFSFLDGERIYAKNDKYGKLEYFGRFYSIMEAGNLVSYCDIVDNAYSTTYKQFTDSTWAVVSKGLHGFKRIPVVYHFRKGGAFWTPAQNNIDKLEILVSELSEDNHSKTRAIYHIATDKPESLGQDRTGGATTVVTDKDGKFSMLQGADISTQFTTTYDILTERIMNPLGMVYPKSKSSGDMPTGSMKMMFFPTERTGVQIHHEFNAPLDAINSLVKEGMIRETPKLASELIALNISASFKMYTPQDDGSVMTALGTAKQNGSLSEQTVAENMPYAANDETKRLEDQAALAEKKLAEQNAQIAIDTPPVPAKPKPKV